MIVGIQPDYYQQDQYAERWATCLKERGIEVRKLNLLASDALEQAQQCDGVMWRWTHTPQDKQSARYILHIIEHYLDIPVFPNSQNAWHFDNKIAQYYLLQFLQAPTPKTWVFWDREIALEWAKVADYPVVFKLSPGAGSANVIRVINLDDAKHLIDKCFISGIFPYSMNEFQPGSSGSRSKSQWRAMLVRLRHAAQYTWKSDYPPLPASEWWQPEKGYVYFQEFLPENDRDTRITVIGERAFGFQRLNRLGDFRASGSGKIIHDPQNIDPRCVDIAFQISQRGNFQSMAYDFLMRNQEPVICEISYAFADWAVQKCPGHWHSTQGWVEGSMWPQEAQVEIFINEIKAKIS